MSEVQRIFDVIEGEKGKGGGGGRPAVEAPNTLASRAVVKVVEVVSEGEIEGLVGGARGIYINDTPLVNSDNQYNFSRTSWDYRVGLPDQPYMTGFPSVEAEITVGSIVTGTTPIVRTVSAPNIDSAKISISLTQGLYSQNTTNGDMNGTSVTFAIDHKLTASGSWIQAADITISGKTTSLTEKQYTIQRPAGTGTWDIRVRRSSADSTSSALRNEIAWSRFTEVQDIKLPYNDTAYVGLAVDAESVGNSIPKRAYLIKGIRCKVPSNYNPTTREYTGLWNGTFQVAWTDNPAWCLYDLLTHPRYGMGEFVSESMIDKFSFYDAAVYNDVLVPDGNGGTEPRFTFNAILNARDEAFKIASMMAGAMRGSLLYAAGQVKLLQDRPADPVKLINNASVLDGMFDYKSSGLQERNTAFNVLFNDREDRYLQRVVTIDASTATGAFKTQLELAEARYGYNPTDILAIGAVTEGQAIRAGMWAIDTVLNQTEIVQFKMSLNGFDLMPGDIVKVWDQDYTTTFSSGRIVSVSGTTVVLDRPVALVAGSKIEVVLADGKTIEERNVVQISGSLSTITISSAFSQPVLEHAVYIMRLAAEARQFRIIGLKQEEAHIVAVEAVLHDPNKYNRIELGVSIPAPVFSNASVTTCNAPTSLQYREIQVNDAGDGIAGQRRSLLVSWIAPTQGIVRTYVVRYRHNAGEWTSVETTTPAYEIRTTYGGAYDIQVFAISMQGNSGPTLDGTYTITTTGGGASTLNAPTTLTVIGGGTNFAGTDLNFTFTNPASNATVLSSTLRDFEVRIIETSGSTTVRTVYVPPVAAGQAQTFSYTYNMNVADGGPRRTLQVQVRCRDTSNNLSDPVTVTFTNPSPATVSNLTAVGGIGSTKITYTLPTDPDFKGVIIWRGTSAGFTPSANANSVTPNGGYIYDGSDSFVADNALSDATQYFYKVAAYDVFAKNLAGTGLNISSAVSATTAAAPGISKGTALPGTAVEGDVFFLTTDDKLYRYTGTVWTAAVPTADLTGEVQAAQIAANAITADKLAANSVIAGKIAAGTITASDIAAGTITATQIATDAITSDKIAAGAVTANEIAAGSITATQLAAGSVTATQIAAGAVTADVFTAGSITGDKLAAGSVTADKLSVTSLSAVTANVGLLRTATTGARMEIENNVIRVYDASGVLRVKLGNLL